MPKDWQRIAEGLQKEVNRLRKQNRELKNENQQSRIKSMKEYIFISNTVGIIPHANTFDWIYWASGEKTREGVANYPEGVKPSQDGMPSHYLRNQEEIAKDLQIAWLPGFEDRLQARKEQEAQGLPHWECVKL